MLSMQSRKSLNATEKNNMPAPAIQVSVVIPVYNSQDCLEELAERLTTALDSLNKNYEIILVNDCSPDKSWQTILRLLENYREVKGVNLRRNFGQDNAIMAGLNYACGDAIVIMDDDLQHNPNDIKLLLSALENGCDVCYAFFDRKRQSWFKNLGSWFNDKAANIILKKPKQVYLSPYKAMIRGVVDEIIKYDGAYPYVDGLLFRVTRNITQVTVKHHKRFSGSGNYTLLKSIRIWSRLATNFSVTPLRIATFLGFVSSAAGFSLAIYYIIRKLVGDPPLGLVTTIVAILFLGGIQLITIGIIGEYVGRLFLLNNKEPQFVVNETVEAKSKNHSRTQKASLAVVER